MPTCGCPENKPEADHTKHPCPCGDHCEICKQAKASWNAAVDACQMRADMTLGKYFISFDSVKEK